MFSLKSRVAIVAKFRKVVKSKQSSQARLTVDKRADLNVPDQKFGVL